MDEQKNLGAVIVNRQGEVCSYVHWPKPAGVTWPGSWDISHPDGAPHVVALLIPVEE